LEGVIFRAPLLPYERHATASRKSLLETSPSFSQRFTVPTSGRTVLVIPNRETGKGIQNMHLITGAAEFIGRCIAAELLRRGEKVRGIDNLSTGKLESLTPLKPMELPCRFE
jgi:hypothetical protein